jgi:hypothetical protein
METVGRFRGSDFLALGSPAVGSAILDSQIKKITPGSKKITPFCYIVAKKG